MIGLTLLVLVVVVMIIGGLLLLPESMITPLRTENEHEPAYRDPGSATDPDVLVEIAEAFESDNQYRKALKYWTRYLELTNDPAGNFRRARVLQELNQHDRALGDFLAVEQKRESLQPSYFLHRAKSWHELDEFDNALDDYERYLNANPDDVEHWLEAARCASRNEHNQRAEDWFAHVAEESESPDRERAKLGLAEHFVDNEFPNEAQTVVTDLDEDRLTSFQQRKYLFVKARIHEELGEAELAHQLYQTLYDRDSTFRNVKQKIKEHSATISDDNLLRDFKTLDRAELAECCRNIVRVMGYEPMQSDSLNEEEVEVTARDETPNLLTMDRYIFTFKQWDGYVGMLPLKEFEMKLLEGHYDRGFFVAPRGFKPSAMEYAADSPKMELIGPEQLVEHLRKIL